jgi:hypothetical protein
LVIDLALDRLSVTQKYLFVSIVTVLTSLCFFSPYFDDGKYLCSTSEIHDYKAVRSAIADLNNCGKLNPTAKEIASAVQLDTNHQLRPGHELTQLAPEARVSAILPYMNGDDFVVLMYQPLYWDCCGMALVCIVFIVFSIAHQFVNDPPRGAYFEKIVWCFLLYCGFEALHFYSYARITSWELFGHIQNLGWYASMSIMLIILFLFIVRLRFIRSVEGRYYESRLRTDPNHITRWRDAFDNWVLRQFMNPRELEQRFLIQSNDDAVK